MATVPDHDPARPSASRPVLIYDGDCGFCRRSIALARRVTRDQVEFLAQQSPDCARRFPQLEPEQLAKSVFWVDGTSEVAKGAKAVALTLATNPRWRWPWWCYRRVPLVAPCAELAYAFVARHRMFFSRLTRPFLPDE